MQPLRIVLTCNFSPWSAYAGGGQWSTHQLALALTQQGHDVTCVFTKGLAEHISVPPLPYAVRWAALPALSSRRNALLRPLSALSVARAVHSLDLQAHDTVIHSQGEEGALLPRVAKLRAAAFVLTLRYPSFPDALTRGGLPRVLALLQAPKFVALQMALHGAQRLTVTSRAAEQSTRAAFQLEPGALRVVPNGVAPEFLAARRTGADGPVLFWGRLSPSKGIDTLLGAVALLGNQCPKVELIGPGEHTWVLRLAKELGVTDKVSLLGSLSPRTIAERASSARLAVLASREESFGNAMLEALVAGVPLITTRVGSIPEVIPEDMASLVEPDSAVQLAAAMRDALENGTSVERRAERGSAWARSHYSWDATAHQFVEIYREALAETAAARMRESLGASASAEK